jgi:hypothetical protein
VPTVGKLVPELVAVAVLVDADAAGAPTARVDTTMAAVTTRRMRFLEDIEHVIDSFRLVPPRLDDRCS